MNMLRRSPGDSCQTANLTGKFFTGLAALVFAFNVGCAETDEPITSDMHEDFDHDHKHSHAGGGDHEHDHDDGFDGSHSHGHTHSHRHGDPVHGGRIVSIGHTHHKGGETHFHAEVMPIEDETIRFFILTETEDGESLDYPIEDKTIPGIVGLQGEEASSSDFDFAAVGDGEESAEFALKIPDRFQSGEDFTVMIPKLSLSGQRQNFSFKVSRTTAAEGEETETPAEAASADEDAEDKAEAAAPAA